MLDVYNGSAFGVSECSQDEEDVKEDEGFATPTNRNRHGHMDMFSCKNCTVE